MAIIINGDSGISGVDGSAGTPALQGTDTNTGISFGTDEVNINTGGTTRVKVDSSGRVGIGNTAPSGANLVINTNSEGGSGIKLIGKSANGGAEIDFRNNADSTLNGFVEFSDTQGVVSTVISGPLTFRTNNTERMRITNTGTVLVGRTTNTSVNSGAALQPSNLAVEVASDTTGSWWNRTDSNAAWVAQRFYAQGSLSGFIQVNTSSVTYSTTSDYRLKENVAPLTGAADRVNQLQVHRFNFIAEPGKTVDGFLAHEAQSVVPECVTGTKDEVDEDGNPVYQGIDQSKLVPLLTAALQEALAKIETLETRLAALEGGTNP